MKVVYKSESPTPNNKIHYYKCDHCSKEFGYDENNCANQMVMPPIKEILKNPYTAHESYKYWCKDCVIELKINPT